MEAPSDRPQWLPPEASGERPRPNEGSPGAPPAHPLPAPPAPTLPPPTQPMPTTAYQPPASTAAPPAQGSPYGAGPPQAQGSPYGAGPPPAQGWYPSPPPGPHQLYGAGYYQPPDTGPGNEPAVVAFVLALSGVGLLLFFAGFSAPVTLVLGILAIVYGRKGKRRVDAGETDKHRGLAQAGWIVGVVTVVLSLLSVVGWALFFIYLDDLNLETPDGPNNPDGFEAVVGVAVSVVRAVGRGIT